MVKSLGMEAQIVASDELVHIGKHGKIIFENWDKSLIFQANSRRYRINRGVFLVKDRIFCTSNRVVSKSLKKYHLTYYK